MRVGKAMLGMVVVTIDSSMDKLYLVSLKGMVNGKTIKRLECRRHVKFGDTK